jgi:uncharacterized membrane protein YheB (UPF0754 family)
MSITLAELTPYLTYITPPIIGAFIGYLTNRVAIRMLFRPLKRWKIGPIPVPMTPGVIPSKRHELALNIGEMVGEQLLTSEEINSSLKKDSFQEHLYYLIESKVGSFLKKDLGPLSSIIHPSYRNYYDIGYKTVTYQIKETVWQYLQSDGCQEVLENAVDGWTQSLFSRDVNAILPVNYRQGIYSFFDNNVDKMFEHTAMDDLIHTFVVSEVGALVQSQKSLQDIVPDSVRQQIIQTINDQAPLLLAKGAQIVAEPEMQEKIIEAIKQAIEEFVASLGPMAAMVNGFLNRDLVEEKIRYYLVEKEADVTALLTSDGVQERVAGALIERAEILFRTPLSELTEKVTDEQVATFTTELSGQIADTLRKKRIARSISSMFQETIETFIKNGSRTIGPVAQELVGKEGIETFGNWLKREIIAMLRSKKNRQVIDYMIENMLNSLVNKPIGRLDHIIPAGVREGLFRSLQAMATKMLTSEVPGVVKSINIRKIVSEKIDSFDLLRLEKLLLTIMEEQFKYINLFGGLLGFLIGCANLFFLLGMK